jgi:hypothetical protein
MKRWIVVLGCYGLMVGSAQAGDRLPTDRWSASVCGGVAKMRVFIETNITNPAELARTRFALLLLQDDHCGVSTRALRDADLAILDRAPRATRPVRPPVLCDTTPKAYGGSTTDCF